MEIIPKFNQLTAAAGREIQAGGKNWLFFGGTAYLGLTYDAEFMDLFVKGVRIYGVNNGTSRNNNVQCGLYEEAEAFAAQRFGAEDALVTSSGFLAAQMLVKYLNGKGELLYAPDCHPALWLHGKPETTGYFSDWASKTVAYINNSTQKNFVVICNTLNNLHPERYDFSVFRHIHGNRHVHFLLDHSHGIGILPNDPDDIRNHLPVHPHFRVSVVASMAKGLGTDAGLVLSDSETIKNLKHSPIYPGASPPAPAALYAFMHAGEIYKRQSEALQRNIRFFQENLRLASQHTKGFPAFCFSMPGLYEQLLQKEIIISAFPYPLPASPLLNRVVINSLHTQEDMKRLLKAIHGDN